MKTRKLIVIEFICYLFFIMIMLFNCDLQAKELKSEDDYVRQYCRGYPGDDIPLPDGTRIDCIWGDYAIEYDWATFKWYECLTQAKWYAMNSGRVAGCVLIIKSDKSWRYVNRAKRLIEHYNEPITLWVLYDGKFEEIK